jgi:DNA-binding LacI/PurR family transcriptional regulator
LSGRPLTKIQLPYVDADNEGGAHQATSYLINQGRSRVATITGPQDMSAGVDRLNGYRRALTDAGIAENPDLIAHGDFGNESGYKGMRELLERCPRLDGVVAASDPMAVAAMRALSRTGRRVPEDVAVIGFDNSSLAETTDPPLTTVHQPVEQMGMEMTRLLVPMLDNPDWVITHRVLPTELVIRKSA